MLLNKQELLEELEKLGKEYQEKFVKYEKYGNLFITLSLLASTLAEVYPTVEKLPLTSPIVALWENLLDLSRTSGNLASNLAKIGESKFGLVKLPLSVSSTNKSCEILLKTLVQLEKDLDKLEDLRMVEILKKLMTRACDVCDIVMEELISDNVPTAYRKYLESFIEMHKKIGLLKDRINQAHEEIVQKQKEMSITSLHDSAELAVPRHVSEGITIQDPLDSRLQSFRLKIGEIKVAEFSPDTQLFIRKIENCFEEGTSVATEVVIKITMDYLHSSFLQALKDEKSTLFSSVPSGVQKLVCGLYDVAPELKAAIDSMEGILRNSQLQNVIEYLKIGDVSRFVWGNEDAINKIETLDDLIRFLEQLKPNSFPFTELANFLKNFKATSPSSELTQEIVNQIKINIKKTFEKLDKLSEDRLILLEEIKDLSEKCMSLRQSDDFSKTSIVPLREKRDVIQEKLSIFYFTENEREEIGLLATVDQFLELSHLGVKVVKSDERLEEEIAECVKNSETFVELDKFLTEAFKKHRAVLKTEKMIVVPSWYEKKLQSMFEGAKEAFKEAHPLAPVSAASPFHQLLWVQDLHYSALFADEQRKELLIQLEQQVLTRTKTRLPDASLDIFQELYTRHVATVLLFETAIVSETKAFVDQALKNPEVSLDNELKGVGEQVKRLLPTEYVEARLKNIRAQAKEDFLQLSGSSAVGAHKKIGLLRTCGLFHSPEQSATTAPSDSPQPPV